MNDIKHGIFLLCQKISETIHSANILVARGVINFIHHDVKILGGLIGAYENFFTRISVTTRVEAERLWTKELIVYKELEESIEQLLTEEENFDNFLCKIDEKLSIDLAYHDKTKQLSEGNIAPDDKITSLSGKITNLKTIAADFRSIIVVFLRHIA